MIAKSFKFVAAFAAIAGSAVNACTYSEQAVYDADGNKTSTVVAVRTMEFGPGLFANNETLQTRNSISAYPRGAYVVPLMGTNNTIVQESNQFGFLAMDMGFPSTIEGMNELWVAAEGMNEAGLTASALVLSASSYETLGNGSGKSTGISFVSFVNFVLATFETVNDVVHGLNHVAVVECYGLPNVLCSGLPKLHWAIADAEGNSIVVEVLEGSVKIYNNTVGTLTNDPTFDFHKTNLATYRNIRQDPNTPTTEAMLKEHGVPFSTSQGYNLFSLPGGSDPTSRFVNIFYSRVFAATMRPPTTIQDAFMQQQAIIQKVFIPYGDVPETHNPGDADYTIWTVMKVPKQKKFFYKTYSNPVWQEVSLGELLGNISKPAHKPVFNGDVLGIHPVTQEFFLQ